MSGSDVGHVFVYGTLRRGFTNHGRDVLALHGRFLSQTTVQGELYDLGSFPALVIEEAASSRVHGEVYELTREPARAIERLDRYEGARGPDPLPYDRIARRVTLSDGTEVEAWTYVWTGEVDQGQPIASGDYVAYLEDD